MADINLASMIAQAALDAGIGFRNSYSGRAMYGRACVAVTGSMDDIQKLVGAVAGELVDLAFKAAVDSDDNTNEAYNTRDEVRAAIESLTQYSWDSMGLDTVVYWRKIEAISDDEMCNALGFPTDEEMEKMDDASLHILIRRHAFEDIDVTDRESLVAQAIRVRDDVIAGRND